ncbi:MAG: DNA-binding response regulator [Acidobacteria bacterium RIFCSPHIGHO2_12_FULL_67_30]|nr:MAG: DNA-binding response regulator [Acidobacteria bacterium RIFCSPHIGHO2_01_FULL_67_28]OFV85021.1 MAG: DNA-binding response regulator [Acidobacteria bacterium RIFCSPHIGHO2_02_FULL_67_57]OFV89630.1 MAG: DNA-binding response regulator [Acidobacteria bacterium RIFCSPHIGHO2_12_FULL_67_30]
MRILLVEDDKKTAAFIAKGLERAGFAVDQAANGEDGLHLALTEPYDAAVIDIMLPGQDGLSLIEEVRRQKVNLPVIFLSARRSVDDRIRGLQAGGDDYLTKPFAFSELLARLRALIRRASSAPGPTSLTVGSLSMDLLKREVVRDAEKLDLQPREFALLEYFLRHPGEVVSKTVLLEHIWGYNFEPQTNVVDVLVCRLRKKLGAEPGEQIIHTIRGVGYVLKDS